MSYPNEFLDLQAAVIARLTATDASVPPPTASTGSVTWLTEIIGDLANKVAQATAKIGICGIVLTPGGKASKMFDSAVGQISLGCPLLIQIQENVTVNQGTNGTKIHALDLVKFCMKRLHFWDPQRSSVSDRGRRSPAAITLDPLPYELVQDTPVLVYDVRFIAPLTIK